ncbi:MAG: DNA-processing protein DprA [Clostridiales bacterium]|nr:DNA-processing protein DprA [Clostridiales bacterium]
MKESQCKQLHIDSPLYPKEWADLPNAPKTLQYVGDATLLQTRKFTVVGSRTTPAQARKLGKEIAADLSQTFTLVTGVADGGDETAIEGAIEAGGKVICLLAGGFSALPQSNLPLLRSVVTNGLLLSPFPFDEPTRKFSYEFRNELLAYLGEGTLVLGAGEKSGALITAKYAKRASRQIFALPYAPGVHAGVGCNALIKEGAHLTESAKDVYVALGIEGGGVKRTQRLTEIEESVWKTLQVLADSHVSEISAKTGVPLFKLRATLSALEMKGLVVSLGGNRYAAVR